jgi:1-acyl-sn-glycerol-3-phosphate acyltransferase
MGRFKQGAFKIAMDMQLPVVPVSLTGCFEAMPSKQLYANPGSQVSLHIGQPIDISQFTDINEAMTYVREKVEEGLKA